MADMMERTTRRTLLGSGAALGSTAFAAACGSPASPATGQSAPPKEVVWALHFAADDPRSQAWMETWRRAEPAAGVKITVTVEGSDRWTKRQAEFAAGLTTVDLMGNQTDWVLPGGLTGVFDDHTAY